MVKLEVTQSPPSYASKVYELTFKYDNGVDRSFKLAEESYKALEEHFKPKEEPKELTVSSVQFDELWSIHKKGNRASAKQRLPKVLKKIKYEELRVLLLAYVKSNDFCYLKGLDVYLNPLKEHWNDPIVKKEDKFKKEEPKKPSFFKD